MVKVTMDTSGLDQLIENVEAMDEQQTVSLTNVLSNEFISKSTSFSSLEEILEKCGVDVNTKEEFEAAIPQLDIFLKENTLYENFKAFYSAAGAEFFKKQLLNGL